MADKPEGYPVVPQKSVISNYDSQLAITGQARVNINTVVKKLPSGEWAFPEVNERFERHKRKHLRKREASDKGEKKIATVLIEVEELRAQSRQLALKSIGWGD